MGCDCVELGEVADVRVLCDVVCARMWARVLLEGREARLSHAPTVRGEGVRGEMGGFWADDD